MDMMLGIKFIFQNSFFLFLVTYVVGVHWNCLIEAIPMCVPTTYVFSKTDAQLFSLFQ